MRRGVSIQSFGRASGGAERLVAEEVAVAISYHGTTQAVLMATPADLADLGRGFTLTEGFAAGEDIVAIGVERSDLGHDVQIWLSAAAEDRLRDRRRRMVGPVGCGLCGIDSLTEAQRTVPRVTAEVRFAAEDVHAAMAALPAHQPLHDQTRAVHAAALYRPGAGIVAAREDVGRHNALDKLVGAAVAEAPGMVIMTSRLSVDLVQKVAMWGMPVLVGASAPTTAAIALAEAAGITLIGLARSDRFDVFAGAERLARRVVPHVA